jgi:phasin family protein
MRGVEQVVALNLSTAKNSMEGALAVGKELSKATDVHGAMAAVSSSVQPGLAGANAYGTELKQILDDIRSEFRDAADTHVGEAKNTLSALIHDVTQNVKPGSENAVEIIKSAIENAFAGYEKVAQATREAVRTVEAQVAKATDMVAPGMGKAGSEAEAAEKAGAE